MCTSKKHGTEREQDNCSSVSAEREQTNSKGTTMTDNNGNQYFVMGKTRIKITEHFADNGKSINELVTDLIEAKIKERITETI